jgi:Flp pilus assembly protein TadD
MSEGATEAGARALQRAIELNPADPFPHFLLARALAKIGQVKESKREMDRFSELKKSQVATGGMATGRAH